MGILMACLNGNTRIQKKKLLRIAILYFSIVRNRTIAYWKIKTIFCIIYARKKKDEYKSYDISLLLYNIGIMGPQLL